uniref:Uncharacterized protein n=1 Tax=Romanomermis culicivorax TaxID=13658 RepID=A0A915IPJ2_ROMCU
MSVENFGARVRSELTGIIYNNEMDDFSLKSSSNYFEIEPTPENRIEPGKRPQSSMGPVIGFDSRTGDVRMVLGAAGGVKIIAATAQVIMRLLYLNETIKEAIDAPRVYNQLLPFNSTYEEGFSQDLMTDLKEIHKQPFNPKVHPFFSVVCGIYRLPNGTLTANSDFRKGGGYTAGF